MFKEDWNNGDLLKEKDLTELSQTIKKIDEELGFNDISFTVSRRCIFIL